jgi:8-oxo-dGTP pyrophosphatase MutT (NUDIX family)
MEKFSKWEKSEEVETNEDDKILFENDVLKVREIDGWSVVEESDCVVCIPYFIEENKFIIRQESVPTYKWVDSKNYHLTVLSGTIEEGETPEETLRRELVEEAGIKLIDSYKIKLEEPLFISKGHVNKFHYCILPLAKGEYTEVFATTDGTKQEMKSKSIKVSGTNIKNLKASDVITELMLAKLTEYMNI